MRRWKRENPLLLKVLVTELSQTDMSKRTNLEPQHDLCIHEKFARLFKEIAGVFLLRGPNMYDLVSQREDLQSTTDVDSVPVQRWINTHAYSVEYITNLQGKYMQMLFF